jgi:hypothetical protein
LQECPNRFGEYGHKQQLFFLTSENLLFGLIFIYLVRDCTGMKGVYARDAYTRLIFIV